MTFARVRTRPAGVFLAVVATALVAWLLATPSSEAGEPFADRAPSLSDRAEVLDLLARYGQYFDQHEAQAWAGLFTPDGELSFPTAATPGAPRYTVKGRDALLAFASRPATPNVTGIHFPGPSVLVMAGPGHIKARTPVAVGEVRNDQLQGATFNGYGVYEDDIVKTRAGWRFAKRTADSYGAKPISPEFMTMPRF
ncbi:nuclear transport factor 2 family protein [Yinghuangia seranimata]|uniref:nuclear transport factor 2 family protein n=1 Tax=Yinghuangia seranimata TaxID=408067 RepID=UPI00248CA03B|nr:nuclear transport factor 2 family protein [Yinghuangia seranimata]MDI2129577.1 nuclear transport factor 2 family protein [Yinghuangia seranimata]